jgi:hypothetical protein
VVFLGGGRLADSSFEQRKKEQIRAVLTTPAKLYTPEEMAKFAEERRLPDKKEQEEFLTREWEIVRSNHHIYHKPANPAQKLGFSLDKPG